MKYTGKMFEKLEISKKELSIARREAFEVHNHVVKGAQQLITTITESAGDLFDVIEKYDRKMTDKTSFSLKKFHTETCAELEKLQKVMDDLIEFTDSQLLDNFWNTMCTHFWYVSEQLEMFEMNFKKVNKQ